MAIGRMNLVEDFINDVQAAEGATGSNLRFVIRHKITQQEKFIRRNGGDIEAINSILQLAKESAFEEITRHSPNGKPTPTAEFFQQVFDALSTRLRTFIDQAKAGYRVNVSIPGGLPHVVKGDFRSEEIAQAWRDSDIGDSVIKTVIAQGQK